MITRVGISGISKAVVRGGFVLAAVCLSSGAVQAQVVQGMTIGNEGSNLPDPNVTSFTDARSRVQIYASGPAAGPGSGGTASGVTIAALVGPTGVGALANQSAIASLAGDQSASGLNGGGMSPVLYATEPGGGGPVSPIPEPGTWLMMIAGFGLVGRGLRRQSGRPVTA